MVDQTGKRVRLGPNSKIRFQRRDGYWTDYIRGRDLMVNRWGMYQRTRGNGPVVGLRWEDLQGAEVRNLSGGKTYAAVLITTLIIGVVVVLLVGAGKGGGGKIKLPGLRGAGRGVGRGVGRGLARGFARGVARGLYHSRWLGPRIEIHPTLVDSDPGPASSGAPTPLPPGSATPPPTPNGADDGSGAPPPPPPAPGAPPSAPPGTSQPPAMALTTPRPIQAIQTSRAFVHPLFSRPAIRRSRILFVGSVEGGTDFSDLDGGSFAAFVGFRIKNVFELAGGARMLSHRGSRTDTQQSLRSSWMGVGRILLHFDIDSARRVALPIGLDMGAGHSEFYLRVNLGIRVRVWDHLSLGLYPFNPTFTRFEDGDLKRKTGWWSFPTTLEAMFMF